MATENLLQEFPPVSTQAWEEAIARDLKGADYARKLIWQTEDGLAVKPYYRAEDLANIGSLNALHWEAGESQGALPSGNWSIREEIDASDPEAANREALKAVTAGAEEITFRNVLVQSASDLGLLLSNLQEIPIHVHNGDVSVVRLLIEHIIGRRDCARISTGFDPLTNLDVAAEILLAAPSALVPFTIDGSELEESGATTVEEIGFALAAGVDFLAETQSRGLEVDRAVASVGFTFAIGANYFFQMAKFRAFRMLWTRAVESFGGSSEGARAQIHARTSRWNETIYDPHVNILRATTEAMSAALGGANSITVAPFDECYKSPDEASRRLARNTQIILKQEALLARVADPGAGSYCLEVITDYIARESWKTMQRIEVNGGFRKAVADGLVNQSLECSLHAREKAVTSRRRVFAGTNQFADPQEKALNRVNPLRVSEARRGAQSFESLRLRSERHEASTHNLPCVLLAEFGDLKMRAARSTFAANLFACAGFGMVARQFSSAAEIAECDADLIVLCSSDAEYLGLATQLTARLQALDRKTPVIVAGNPESGEQLRAAGVADFIHIRSNPIEFLTHWQQRLGIKD